MKHNGAIGPVFMLESLAGFAKSPHWGKNFKVRVGPHVSKDDTGLIRANEWQSMFIKASPEKRKEQHDIRELVEARRIKTELTEVRHAAATAETANAYCSVVTSRIECSAVIHTAFKMSITAMTDATAGCRLSVADLAEDPTEDDADYKAVVIAIDKSLRTIGMCFTSVETAEECYKILRQYIIDSDNLNPKIILKGLQQSLKLVDSNNDTNLARCLDLLDLDDSPGLRSGMGIVDQELRMKLLNVAAETMVKHISPVGAFDTMVKPEPNDTRSELGPRSDSDEDDDQTVREDSDTDIDADDDADGDIDADDNVDGVADAVADGVAGVASLTLSTKRPRLPNATPVPYAYKPGGSAFSPYVAP